MLETCSIPKTAAWVTRKILEARQVVLQSTTMQGNFDMRLSTMLTKAGAFSIKRAYLTLLPQLPRAPWKSLTLQHSIHPRHKFTLWLAVQQKLATVDRLLRYGIQVPMECAFCKSTDETFEHLFFNCPITAALKERMLKWLKVLDVQSTWQEELQRMCKLAQKKTGIGPIASCVFAMLIYTIWRERNQLRFHTGTYDEERVSREIVILVHIRGQAYPKWKKTLDQLNVYP